MDWKWKAIIGKSITNKLNYALYESLYKFMVKSSMSIVAIDFTKYYLSYFYTIEFAYEQFRQKSDTVHESYRFSQSISQNLKKKNQKPFTKTYLRGVVVRGMSHGY